MSAIFVFPVLWTILTSIKVPVDAFSIPPKWIFTPTLNNLITVWTKLNFPYYLTNSLIVSLSAAAATVGLGALAAYGFSRTRTTISLLTLLLLLCIRMFPQILLAIPFFLLAQSWQLYNTVTILFLTYTSFELTFAIWMLRGFFMAVPTDLDDAAMMDGCSELRAFWRVILPNVIPGLVATFFLIFLSAFNEYMFALVLTSSTKTLPVAISGLFRAELIEYWSWSTAAATGMIIPALVIMVFLQKHLIRGYTFGIGKS